MTGRARLRRTLAAAVARDRRRDPLDIAPRSGPATPPATSHVHGHSVTCTRDFWHPMSSKPITAMVVFYW
jgi:hypothetical protein